MLLQDFYVHIHMYVHIIYVCIVCTHHVTMSAVYSVNGPEDNSYIHLFIYYMYIIPDDAKLDQLVRALDC